MDSQNQWPRVPYAEHPDRCQSNRGNQGQCWNTCCEGSEYCAAHGGNRAPQEAAKRELADYRTNVYLERQKAFEGSADLLSLNKEVSFIKALLDAKLALIKDEHSFLLYSGGASDLIMKAEKLVTSCARLNDKLGMSLNAQQAMAFTSDVLAILSEEINAEILAKIQSRISDSLSRRSDRLQRGESDE